MYQYQYQDFVVYLMGIFVVISIYILIYGETIYVPVDVYHKGWKKIVLGGVVKQNCGRLFNSDRNSHITQKLTHLVAPSSLHLCL